jgi:hypothetical protein
MCFAAGFKKKFVAYSISKIIESIYVLLRIVRIKIGK